MEKLLVKIQIWDEAGKKNLANRSKEFDVEFKQLEDGTWFIEEFELGLKANKKTESDAVVALGHSWIEYLENTGEIPRAQ